LRNAAADANVSVNVSSTHCLCIFDFDRTLTGKQGDTHHCSKNQVIQGIHDSAYGGGLLTLSELALGLDKTFCKHCYLGVISHGDADGEKSAMRARLLVMLNYNKEQKLRVADAWSTPTSSGHVTAPLAIKVPDSQKHQVAHGIRSWYSSKGISFTAAETHFFDDNVDNVKEFLGSGYNVRQVSCKSRDNTRGDKVGWCGGVVSECVANKGVHLCGKSGDDPVADGLPTVVV
jgi:hypothetical protein